jgi:hypothetical protein
MQTERELQLMKRCADYLFELAEIYSSGGTDHRHILPDLKEVERHAGYATTRAASFREFIPSAGKRIRWVDDIRQALIDLGGKAHLSKIEGIVRSLRREGGRSWPKNADACIRYALETHCPDSLNYSGGPKLFAMVERGSGYWQLTTPRR